MTESDQIKLPKVFWGVVTSLAGLSLLLLASFFSWLGITTVGQGESLKVQGSTLDAIQNSIQKIDDKLENLPPKEVLQMPILIQALQQDAVNRENQLDALERRVDVLEKK